MGRVYSPKDVMLERVPEIGAHEQAARFIMTELIEAHDSYVLNNPVTPEEPGPPFGIDSGMIYGSVAMGSANRRSDLDVLINYADNHAESILPHIGSVFRQVEERFGVFIEPNLLPVGALFDSRQHSIDPLFAEHLIAVQQQKEPRWSYNWPVNALMLSEQRLDPEDQERTRAIALRYVRAKSTLFVRAWVGHREGAGLNLHALQRALELPTALGRKILAATCDGEISDELISGNRAGVRQMLFERLETIDWPGVTETGMEPMTRLQAHDEEYSELLEGAINGNVSIKDYEAWIRAQVPNAYFLALVTSKVWSDILSKNLDRRKYEEEMKRSASIQAEDETY